MIPCVCVFSCLLCLPIDQLIDSLFSCNSLLCHQLKAGLIESLTLCETAAFNLKAWVHGQDQIGKLVQGQMTFGHFFVSIQVYTQCWLSDLVVFVFTRNVSINTIFGLMSIIIIITRSHLWAGLDLTFTCWLFYCQLLNLAPFQGFSPSFPLKNTRHWLVFGPTCWWAFAVSLPPPPPLPLGLQVRLRQLLICFPAGPACGPQMCTKWLIAALSCYHCSGAVMLNKMSGDKRHTSSNLKCSFCCSPPSCELQPLRSESMHHQK